MKIISIILRVILAIYFIFLLGVIGICISDVVRYINGDEWLINHGGWFSWGLVHLFSPVYTIFGILFIIGPCYFIYRKESIKNNIRPIILSTICILFVWISTLLHYYCLPLGMQK